MLLTQKYLKELLDYNPETGIWTWLIQKPDSKMTAGKIAGTLTKQGYRQICINHMRYRAARLAFLYMIGRWPKPEVDHDNRIRHDDRWFNLKEATRSENNLNRETRNGGRKSKLGLPKGVKKRGKRFISKAFHCHKEVWLGTYDTSDEAHQAYVNYVSSL